MTYTPIPAQPTNGQNPWYATMAAWMDGVELAISEVDAHSADAAVHVPSGGTLGQALVKDSGADGDFSWQTISGGGGVTDHGALTGLSDPDHPIAAVSGLQAALDGKSATTHNHTGTYDPAGTAAAAVSTHAGLADPHPGYLTPAEGAAAYAPLAQAVPSAGTTGWVLTKTAGGFAWAAPSGGSGVTPPVTITGTDPATVPMTIKAAAGQTAQVWSIQASDSTVWACIEPDGDLRVGAGVNTANGRFKVGADDPAKGVAVFKMAAAQTAKGITLLDNGNAEKFSVDKDGMIVGANLGGAFRTAIVLDASETIPSVPAGTIVLRRPA